MTFEFAAEFLQIFFTSPFAGFAAFALACHCQFCKIYGATIRFVGGKLLYAAITDAAVTATTWPLSGVLLNIYRHRCKCRRTVEQTCTQRLEFDRCPVKGESTGYIEDYENKKFGSLFHFYYERTRIAKQALAACNLWFMTPCMKMLICF